MLDRKALPQTLLWGGWALLWAMAPWPFFFMHWVALGACIAGVLALRPVFKIHRKALTLLGGPFLLLLWMWLNNFFQCEKVVFLPGPYVFWLVIPGLVAGLDSSNARRLISLAWIILTFATGFTGLFGVLSMFLYGFSPNYLPEHSWTFRFREEFARHTGLHPPYFGMFASASVVYLSDLLAGNLSFRHRLFTIWGIVLLVVLLWLMETRIHLVVLCVGFLLYKPALRRYIGLLALGLLAMTLVFKREHRFQELFSSGKNSATLRLEAWRCGFRLFEEAPLAGQGSCRLQARLNACYDADNRHLQGMNTHNQFLHFAAAGGLVAFILWMLWWIFLVTRLLKNNNAISYKFQVLLLFSFCLTENVLERQWGGILAGLVLAGSLFDPFNRYSK
jgi:hypothetical protein